MPLFTLTNENFFEVPETTFQLENVHERGALQEAIARRIDVIDSGLLVIAKEFNRWEGSSKRIDLLALDKSANLVVLELKRTGNDKTADLQAIRYAGLVSVLSREEIVSTYDEYLRQMDINKEARECLCDFLGVENIDELVFADKVRIYIVAQNFHDEVIATTLWLNSQGLDITCFKMTPYNKDGEVMVYIEQLLPLPEAREWQDKFKIRDQEASETIQARHQYKLDVTVEGKTQKRLPKGRSILYVVKKAVEMGIKTPEEIADILQRNFNNAFAVVDGEVSSEGFTKKAKSYDQRRYFINDDQLIVLSDKTYAFTNQWGDPNFTESMNNLKASLPMNIEFVRSS